MITTMHQAASLSLALVTSVLAGPGDDIAFMRGGSVWAVDASTGQERRLVELQYDRPLTWSPDGASLLYWKHAAGWDLWRVTVDGAETVNLTPDHEGGCRSPSYSPDGKHIAFMRDQPPGVYVMAASGGAMRRLTARGHRDVPPTWAPDGTRVAYVDLERAGEGRVRPRIGVVDLEGNDRVLDGSADWPCWSPGGRWIACTASRDGNVELLLLDPDGGERVLTRTDARESWPVFSPDGSSIALIAGVDDGIELRVVSVADGSARSLARFQGHGWVPSWSPDGRRIAVSAGPRGDESVMVVPAGGGAAHPVAGGGAEFATWRPR